MSHPPHSLARQRALLGWSQAELARRAGIPRTSISAIEAGRLTPSVTSALALSRAVGCSVEELFGGGNGSTRTTEPQFAWEGRGEPLRYWAAEMASGVRLFPVEAPAALTLPHDGLWRDGTASSFDSGLASRTLVVACCDPAAGLMASEYARASGFRLLALSRGGGEALRLLKLGLVHVAGLHRSTRERPERNRETVRAQLGDGFKLLRSVSWEEGLALPRENRARSASGAIRQARRWALREPGSAARECLDEQCHAPAGRVVLNHAAVAEAVLGGWADAGVCVQLAAEQAGLRFLPMRTETLDLCFPAELESDPRVQALLRLLQSHDFRRLLGELPGYHVHQTGAMMAA